MKILLEISEQEIRESVTRALQHTGRRLSVVDWVIRDLTENVPFHAGSRNAQYAKMENFRPLVAEIVRKHVSGEAFEAGLTPEEKADIMAGKAVLSSDGGKYHAAY